MPASSPLLTSPVPGGPAPAQQQHVCGHAGAQTLGSQRHLPSAPGCQERTHGCHTVGIRTPSPALLQKQIVKRDDWTNRRVDLLQIADSGWYRHQQAVGVWHRPSPGSAVWEDRGGPPAAGRKSACPSCSPRVCLSSSLTKLPGLHGATFHPSTWHPSQGAVRCSQQDGSFLHQSFVL